MTCPECVPFKTILSEVTAFSEPSLSLFGFVGLWKEQDCISQPFYPFSNDCISSLR